MSHPPYRTRSDTLKLQRLISTLKQRGSDLGSTLESSAADFLSDVKKDKNNISLPHYEEGDSDGSSFEGYPSDYDNDEWGSDWEEDVEEKGPSKCSVVKAADTSQIVDAPFQVSTQPKVPKQDICQEPPGTSSSSSIQNDTKIQTFEKPIPSVKKPPESLGVTTKSLGNHSSVLNKAEPDTKSILKSEEANNISSFTEEKFDQTSDGGKKEKNPSQDLKISNAKSEKSKTSVKLPIEVSNVQKDKTQQFLIDEAPKKVKEVLKPLSRKRNVDKKTSKTGTSSSPVSKSFEDSKTNLTDSPDSISISNHQKTEKESPKNTDRRPSASSKSYKTRLENIEKQKSPNSSPLLERKIKDPIEGRQNSKSESRSGRKDLETAEKSRKEETNKKNQFNKEGSSAKTKYAIHAIEKETIEVKKESTLKAVEKETVTAIEKIVTKEVFVNAVDKKDAKTEEKSLAKNLTSTENKLKEATKAELMSERGKRDLRSENKKSTQIRQEEKVSSTIEERRDIPKTSATSKIKPPDPGKEEEKPAKIQKKEKVSESNNLPSETKDKNIIEDRNKEAPSQKYLCETIAHKSLEETKLETPKCETEELPKTVSVATLHQDTITETAKKSVLQDSSSIVRSPSSPSLKKAPSSPTRPTKHVSFELEKSSELSETSPHVTVENPSFKAAAKTSSESSEQATQPLNTELKVAGPRSRKPTLAVQWRKNREKQRNKTASIS